jgi:SAM-dependent methyltransferase
MLKYATQKGLSLLPFGTGKVANRWLQRHLGGLRNEPIYGFRRALVMAWLLETHGCPVEGKTFCELGTGWDASAALTLLSLGAAEVHSFDLNRHLDPHMMKKGEGMIRYREGYRETDELPFSPDVESILIRTDSAKLRYDAFIYHAPADARSTALPEESVDVYFSLAVLEHVPVEVMREILAESFRILKPGGFCYHYVQPAMHAVQVDPDVTSVEYLRLSDFWWKALFANGISYENRMRAPEYAQLLNEAGFDIRGCWHTLDQKALAALPRMRLDHRFARFTPEELATNYVWVLCRKR